MSDCRTTDNELPQSELLEELRNIQQNHNVSNEALYKIVDVLYKKVPQSARDSFVSGLLEFDKFDGISVSTLTNNTNAALEMIKSSHDPTSFSPTIKYTENETTIPDEDSTECDSYPPTLETENSDNDTENRDGEDNGNSASSLESSNRKRSLSIDY